ncbi:hypothetical protein RhiJN_10181 [Ceratobasidium sp. AG-Ba]|nr:hypothetical protein RhiJN_10181 [Ceratobasidium sp. AG-Ba]QRW10934.1 hypothetical protein RhiLY_09933 [Ceratobasidium sp. AG-Ba]
MPVTTLLSIVFLALGSAEVALSAKAKCVNTFPSQSAIGGLLTTDPYGRNATDENPTAHPYYFNKAGFLAFDPTGASHAPIRAFFQTCTPNWAQNPNDEAEQPQLFGRFYIPSMKKCLAVTNPSGNAPYYVSTANCPTPEEMTTKASIPFNFMAATDDSVDMRWVGNTIPSKNIWQSGCSKYNGQIFVNATVLGSGWNTDSVGQPNTIPGGTEDYRVHLYCPHGTATNDFVVPT